MASSNQDKKQHLLFICSFGHDRSPAAAALFFDSPKYEAKFAGTSPLADIAVTTEAIRWADLIFVMEPEHKRFLLENFHSTLKTKQEIILLDVPNQFSRIDPRLLSLLRQKLRDYLG